MKYPNRIVKLGEADPAVIAAVRKQLAARGYAIPASSAGFDPTLKSLVKLFQSQNADVNGAPLKIDGELGPLSWGSLFGVKPVAAPSKSAAAAALATAIGEIGMMEVPPGSNSGPRVNQYLASTGLGGGFFWCMAFVHWCFREGAKGIGVANPFPKTAGCIDAWNRVKKATPGKLITKAQAQANPALVKPGAVFILDFGKGQGHTGIVKANSGGALVTIEGNSNPTGSSNGVGVFELNRRSVMSKDLRGFINFT